VLLVEYFLMFHTSWTASNWRRRH